MCSARNRPDFPDRKISETLIDFAQPFVAMIDERTTEEQVRHGFLLAVTVWNAVVFDAVDGNTKYLDMIWQRLPSASEDDLLLRHLVDRKKRHFANDMRAIGKFTVTYEEGHLHVTAEARDPYSSKPGTTGP